MSRIDDLIRNLCPDGVEYKPLGEVGRLLGGLTGKTKADFVDGTARYVSYKNVYSNLEVDVTADDFVRISDSETQNTLQIGDILFTGSSENREEIGLTSVITSLPPEPLYLNSFCICFRPTENFILLPAFAKHLFRSGAIRHQVTKTATGVTRINISRKNLAKIQVPLPPAEVQQEIAMILDQFTQLEAELEAELEARRQQYFHYCTSAFDFATNVEWTTLERVSLKISSGGTPSSSNSAYYGGNIPWVRSQDVNFNMISSTSATISDIGLKTSAAKWIPSNSLIIAMYGASAARAAINTIPVTTNQACCNLQLDATKVTPRYAYHWIYSQYNKLRSLGEGSQSNLNSRKIKNYPIPVPSLNEQRRITDALDQFHSLVNDLTSGLPAEIEARRKQYEYYRDRLLTFPEKK
ncbi:restriction endonuclease subunit S [Actinomyces oris]